MGLRADDLPAFDRRFLEGLQRLTRIGSGSIGGKAAGLVFIRDVLASTIKPGAFPGIDVRVPTMTVIGTDLFDQFVAQNGLATLPVEDLSDERIAHAFQRGELPPALVGDLRALVEKMRLPLAIRSSSLLEDALFRPFAGVYATKMIPNNALGPDVRFKRLAEAIKFVWASTWFREARDYIRATDRSPSEEKMAVIVQEVVGLARGPRFYPDVSGVARSYNFYPAAGARPEDGVVDLALGLGKQIVDGGVAWTYAPATPRKAPPFGSVREMLTQTQTQFWAVGLGAPNRYDPASEVEFMEQGDLRDAENDGALRYVASTYDPQRDRLLPGVAAKGPRVIDFAPLLQLEEFPLNGLVRALLLASERAADAKVEIEFALTVSAPRGLPAHARLGFLQVRPMVVSAQEVDVTAGDLGDSAALLASDRTMGNGEDRAGVVVYVRPERFDVMDTREIAEELGAINRQLVEAREPYVLVGFGRWGSSQRTLGIPVNWAQIGGARAIVESTLPEMNPEPSQGSHFFHNLSSFRVSYFMLRHDGPHRIDWNWLAALPAVAETDHVRAVRTPAPLTIRVDGRTGRGVILKPAAP